MNRSKPKLWEYMFGIFFAVMALLRGPIMALAAGLPSPVEFVLDFLTGNKVFAIGCFIGLGVRWGIYLSMSPREQREADRAEKDERNVAIRGQASYACLNATWIGTAVLMMVLYYRGLQVEALLCGGLTLASIFSLPVIQHWYSKRM